MTKEQVINLYKYFSQKYEPWNLDINDEDLNPELTMIDDELGSLIFQLEENMNISKDLVNRLIVDTKKILIKVNNNDRFYSDKIMVLGIILFILRELNDV